MQDLDRRGGLVLLLFLFLLRRVGRSRRPLAAATHREDRDQQDEEP
jgi:hypothetical protein